MVHTRIARARTPPRPCSRRLTHRRGSPPQRVRQRATGLRGGTATATAAPPREARVQPCPAAAPGTGFGPGRAAPSLGPPPRAPGPRVPPGLPAHEQPPPYRCQLARSGVARARTGTRGRRDAHGRHAGARTCRLASRPPPARRSPPSPCRVPCPTNSRNLDFQNFYSCSDRPSCERNTRRGARAGRVVAPCWPVAP